MYHLKASVFEAIRDALNDIHPNTEKDWYEPFVHAMCASEEHDFREAIGMPDVIEKDGSMGNFGALKYSTYWNIVMSGAKYPNLEWEEAWKQENLEEET